MIPRAKGVGVRIKRKRGGGLNEIEVGASGEVVDGIC